MDVCFRCRSCSLRRCCAARCVTPTPLRVLPPVFRTVHLFNVVVVHRPAGELGVSDGHRTPCAPPEDNDLQHPDDSPSVYPSV